MTTFVLAILGQYVPLAVSYLPLGVLAAEGKNCPLQLLSRVPCSSTSNKLVKSQS